jgi:ElaB/YqjD/DUF883 family membrane-anchored ribosome-binding protein
MAKWQEIIEDKLAEIDLWAVNQVNGGLESLSAQTDRVVTNLKDKTRSKAGELKKEAQSQIKNMGEKMKEITQAVWQKRPKI